MKSIKLIEPSELAYIIAREEGLIGGYAGKHMKLAKFILKELEKK